MMGMGKSHPKVEYPNICEKEIHQIWGTCFRSLDSSEV